MSCVFLHHPSLYLLRPGLPLTPELTATAGLASQLAPGSPCLHFPVIRITGGHHTHLTFYGEAGDSNSRPYTCAASTLSTEPPPYPLT